MLVDREERGKAERLGETEKLKRPGKARRVRSGDVILQKSCLPS